MKVAIVYDRVNKWGGAERVLLALHEIFPNASLYTSVYEPSRAPWAKVFPKIYTSFLEGWGWARRHHEWLASLMPIVFESFDFNDYDLVVSVTSEAAKGIITKPPTKHICYCLTPTRYLWSGYGTYFQGGMKRWITQPVVGYLRKWDRIAAQRPDVMVGISREVVGRIKKYYGRESKVVYPPVSFDDARNGRRVLSLGSLAYIPPGNNSGAPSVGRPAFVPPVARESYYLIVSRLVPYKRVDLAIEAFNRLGLPLVVVGIGSEEEKLKQMAGPNIYFLGQLTDGELARYYEKASALIFPQEEDFGLVALEAQSMGTPVIAYKGGGVLETVVPGLTGEFFWPQTVRALVRAVDTFDKEKYNPKLLMANAKKFSKERFKREFLKLIKL